MSADVRKMALGAGGGSGLLGRVILALKIREERRALAAADEAVLADIGLSREEAAREAGRSFWDLPTGRK